jgi:lysophospholipase L1-like esterase
MKKLILTLWMAAALAAASTHMAAQQVVWTGSWAAAPFAAPATVHGSPESTYRNIVHLSLGGKALRLRISNEFGATPLTVASVHVSLSAGEDQTKPGTDHAVTFGGAGSVTVPAGSMAVSDAVTMTVPPFADLAVSLYVPAMKDGSITYHGDASSTNYVAAGDVTSATTLAGATKLKSWYLLKGVDVDAGPKAASVVVLGASIADGAHSTPDKNARWPDVLAARLAAAHIGVLNEGIGGNRVLHDMTGPSAVARLDRDVLAQSGAKYLIISLGTNDIGRTFFPLRPNEEVTVEQLEWGYQQLVLRAHARGIKVYGTTLNPFAGAAYYSPAGETMRQAVNAFAKTSGVFDGVIDFDIVTRDPAHPEQFLPAYDSGDHLHPNDAGYKVMGEAIDLKLFESK